MTRRLLLALILVSTAFVVSAFVLVTRLHRQPHIVAVLPFADGITVGGAVTLRGKKIGQIEKLTIDGRRILADLRFTESDVGLRRHDSVRLRALGLGGEKALDIVGGESSAPLMEDGDTIFVAHPPRATRLHSEDHRIGRSAVDRVGPNEVATALGGVKPTARGVVFPGSKDKNAQYVFNRRMTQSDVEQHDEWDDILFVQEGRGFVHHGGRWQNGRPIYQGERRGGSLVDPEKVEVGPGDVVRIPAGEPHRIVPGVDTPLTYLVVKVRVDRGK
jgi:mannose-6-phosphate isomerase-like protein (cupin superfamily)